MASEKSIEPRLREQDASPDPDVFNFRETPRKIPPRQAGVLRSRPEAAEDGAGHFFGPAKRMTAGTLTASAIRSAISGVMTAHPPRSNRDTNMVERAIFAAKSDCRMPTETRAIRRADGLVFFTMPPL